MKDTPTLTDLAGIARDRAAAEACEFIALVQYRDAEIERIESADLTPMRRLVERATIPLQIGQATGLSEGQVVQRLATADRILDHAPRVWLAFLRGTVDAQRVREISLAVDKLERDASHRELDATVVAYAASHTVAELRRWLRRFVTRVESDLAIERADAERAKRHVAVSSADDAMSWLTAYLPAHHAAAIATRLRREARALDTADDDRTLEQRKADLLVERLLHTPSPDEPGFDGTVTGLKIDIGVTLDAAVLAGEHDGHAESADGSWEVPTDWLLESALVGDAFWHRLLVDPIIGDTLAHTYLGYTPPAILRRAIGLRDGVCVSPGCLRPAAECDLDHRQPWPEGPTSGANLDPRCRRHHAMKGHGVLDAVRRAQDARSRPLTRQQYRQSPYRRSRNAEALARRAAWYSVEPLDVDPAERE